MMTGIKEIAESLGSELKRRLPKQRKRPKLALLVATMLDVRSANLMDLAAGLPLEAGAFRQRAAVHALLMDHPAAGQPPGDQRRDHGAVRARGAGAGSRTRRAAG